MAFLIGSGFATGQEAMQFFVAYGFKGVVGALISLLFFIYMCTSLMTAGKRYGLLKNEDVFKHYCGNIIGVFLTWYTMIFIVAVHAIMLAGAGATLHQAYGTPVFVGSGLMAMVSMATLLLGLNKIVDIMGVIGPLIIVLTMFIAVMTIFDHSQDIASGAELIPELDILKASPHWLFSGMLYVGLTLPGMASFLPAVGASCGSDGEIRYSAILGPVFYIGAMIMVVLALMSNISVVYHAEIPILALASDSLPVYGAIFACVIFLGIYTTVTPLLWTVCERFSDEKTMKYYLLVVCLSLVGLFGGLILPFGKLVNLIYPTVGYAGLLFLSCAIIKDLKYRFNSTG